MALLKKIIYCWHLTCENAENLIFILNFKHINGQLTCDFVFADDRPPDYDMYEDDYISDNE